MNQEMNLDAISIEKKSGEEFFTIDGAALSFKLKDFWSWSTSDILGNAMRGILAEFIVACDLKAEHACRVEWDAYDLITHDGIKVEVKSSAYLQSWKQNKHSEISFSISPAQAWDSQTNVYSTENKRQADVYVFCLLAHKDKKTVNPLNLSQWEFYILATSTLNEKAQMQKTIKLNSLLKLNPVKVAFGGIRQAIDQVLEEN